MIYACLRLVSYIQWSGNTPRLICNEVLEEKTTIRRGEKIGGGAEKLVCSHETACGKDWR